MRSFSHQEQANFSDYHFSVDTAVAPIKKEKKTHWNFPSFSLLEAASQKLADSFRPKVTLWDSKSYFPPEIFSSPEKSVVQDKQKKRLTADLSSFFDEYARFAPVVNYDYGPNGMQNGYDISMSDIAANHVTDLKEKELETERALMELAVAQKIEQWMSNEELSVGSKLIGVSPRGTKAEGYPGLDERNYIFVNVFEKTENGFVLQQYRSYEPNNKLNSFQSELRKLPSAQLVLATQNQKRNDLQVINSLIATGPEASLQQVEAEIYRHKDQWKVSIEDDLPQINGAAYYEQMSQAVNSTLEVYEEVLEQSDDQEVAEKSFSSLVTIVKEALTKWVETHATNYEQTETPFEIDFSQLKHVWEVKMAKEAGETLSREDRSVLKIFDTATSLNAALPLNRVASFAHCAIGTPFSALRLQSINQLVGNPQMLQALKINSISKEQLAQFIGEERAKLWKPGTCVGCGNSGLVGECSLCLNCELIAGGQISEETMLDQTKDSLLSSLSGKDREKAQSLFKELSKALLRPVVSFEQLLVNDFINPEAAGLDGLEPVLQRISMAPNGLHELEVVVSELTGKDKVQSGKQFVFPQETQIQQNKAA